MRYPDLGMEWIMDDEELPKLEPDRSELQSEPTKQVRSEPQIVDRLELAEKKIPATSPVQTNLKAPEKGQYLTGDNLKAIEKILVFYTDGTFKQYSPQ